MSVAQTSHIDVHYHVITAPLPYIVNTIAHRFPTRTATAIPKRSGLKEVAEINYSMEEN